MITTNYNNSYYNNYQAKQSNPTFGQVTVGKEALQIIHKAGKKANEVFSNFCKKDVASNSAFDIVISSDEGLLKAQLKPNAEGNPLDKAILESYENLNFEQVEKRFGLKRFGESVKSFLKRTLKEVNEYVIHYKKDIELQDIRMKFAKKEGVNTSFDSNGNMILGQRGVQEAGVVLSV